MSSERPDARQLDFQALYDEFQPRIRRYLSRLVGTSEAEDLTQEVFAKVSRALPGFRGNSKVSTWLYRIATNTAYDRFRSPSTRRADEVPLDGPTAEREQPPGIEQDLVRHEVNACIRQYIDALPPSYRSVVILSEHEGLTNQEIAEALGVSLDTVKIRLHRARGRLKRDLGDGCDLYRDERGELACERRADAVSRIVGAPSIEPKTGGRP
jgi:RNA polymerase sigma-70 factor (ECF subfamily)